MAALKALPIGLLVLLLAGCATLSPTESPTDQFIGRGAIKTVQFSGRIAVRHASDSDSGKIEWRSQQDQQRVELLSPLGSTVAYLTQTPGEIHLTLSDHREFSAPDPEQLTQTVLGYPLPLGGLTWWILGEPAPGEAADIRRDAEGHAATLIQAGWLLDYSDWRRVGQRALPGRIRLQRGDLTIRLVIDRWQLEGVNP